MENNTEITPNSKEAYEYEEFIKRAIAKAWPDGEGLPVEVWDGNDWNYWKAEKYLKTPGKTPHESPQLYRIMPLEAFSDILQEIIFNEVAELHNECKELSVYNKMDVIRVLYLLQDGILYNIPKTEEEE